MESPPWAHIVFAIATVTTVPLYLLILIAILWRPKLTPFHTLMVSQGVADIVSLLTYNFFTVVRQTKCCNNFYWEHRHFTANMGFIFTYFILYVRCIGIALISLQRYITVCQFGTKARRIMMEAPAIILVMLHWLPGLLMTIPLLMSFNTTYDSKEDMNVIVPVNALSLANLISVISVVILFLLCIFCYVPVLTHILRSKMATNSVKRHEIRLSIQVAGLLVAFLLVFIYSVGNYIINELREVRLLYAWREMNPLVHCFLSCVLPWMCLFFNEDVQARLSRMMRCRRTIAVQDFRPDFQS